MKLVAKIVIINVFCFLKWEFQLCEACAGLTRRYCSSTHKNKLLSYIFRSIISQKVWKKYLGPTNWTTYINLQVVQLLIKFFQTLQFRTEVSTMLCFVSRWVSGWPEFFYVSSAKKNKKKENLSQFGCVFCHILAQMFPHSMLQTDWVLHRLN